MASLEVLLGVAAGVFPVVLTLIGLRSRTPAGRWGTPDDLAGIAGGHLELQHLAHGGRVGAVQRPALAVRAPLAGLQARHRGQVGLLGQAGGQGGADVGQETGGADDVVGGQVVVDDLRRRGLDRRRQHAHAAGTA